MYTFKQHVINQTEIVILPTTDTESVYMHNNMLIMQKNTFTWDPKLSFFYLTSKNKLISVGIKQCVAMFFWLSRSLHNERAQFQVYTWPYNLLGLSIIGIRLNIINMHTECVYVSLSVWLTDPLGFEQFEGDCGRPSASALGGDDDLALVIFSRTHSTHYLTSRHPFSC